MSKQLKTPPMNSEILKMDPAHQPDEVREEDLSEMKHKMMSYPTEKTLSTNGLIDSRHDATLDRGQKMLFSADKAVDSKVKEA